MCARKLAAHLVGKSLAEISSLYWDISFTEGQAIALLKRRAIAPMAFRAASALAAADAEDGSDSNEDGTLTDGRLRQCIEVAKLHIIIVETSTQTGQM